MTGIELYHQTLRDFHKSKKSAKHKAYKFALDTFKGVMGAHSANEAAVNLTAEVCKSVIANGMTLGIPGASDLANFAIGKVVDMASGKVLEKIRGTKAEFVNLEYEFNDTIGDAMAEANHHIRMLVDADHALKAAVDDWVKVANNKKSTSNDLKKQLKTLLYAFHAMMWAWRKAHHDAAAVCQAAKLLEKFVKDSDEILAKQEGDLIGRIDLMLKTIEEKSAGNP